MGDRTERMKMEPEKKGEASGGVSPGGEQGPSYRNFTYRSLDHMKPDTLVKEIKPSELRAWRFKYEQWVTASFQGHVPLDVEINTFLCF